MITCKDLWNGIDLLAAKNNMSCCGLARKSGLDSTIFNKSKRESKYGQPRWLSTETLFKVLYATKTSFGSFEKLLKQRKGKSI